MYKKLFIVESPNKCAKIQKYLGSEYKVVASVGHVREIPRKGINIDIENGYTPKFVVSSNKKKTVKDILTYAKNCDEIILATDNDMEGEAISWHLYDLFSKDIQRKCVRVVFNEITKKAILKALEEKGGINIEKVEAQKARQVLDRLIGYTISPLLWKNVENNTSAGRVQSIALNLVVAREKEIQKFKPEKFWYIDCDLKAKEGDFIARVVTDNKDNRFTEEKSGLSIKEKLNSSKFKIKSIDKYEKSVKPYPPFDTASLQTACSSLFGWKSKRTSSLAQSLYESGMVTYIRSDSFKISEEALDSLFDYIDSNLDKKYKIKKPNIYSKKGSSSQEAHECIRPTDVNDDGSKLVSSDEKKLYKLIRDRFIACQMPDLKTSNVTYNVRTNTKIDLVAKGQSIIFGGWKDYYPYSKSNETFLPNAEEGEVLSLNDVDMNEHMTQPPPRYNEGSLVKKLEKDGVGRPSTYASIMESIQKRGYVEEIKGKKGSLMATELGIKVNDYLEPNFNKDFFMEIKFTSELEELIDGIQNGDATYFEVVDKVYKKMVEEISKISNNVPYHNNSKDTGEKCISCGKGKIVEKNGKYGKFYACSEYPKCKTIFEKTEDGFEIKKKATAQNTGIDCEKCSDGKLIKRENKKNKSIFYGCNKWPRCKCVVPEEEFIRKYGNS